MWALIGAAVLVAGIIAIIVASALPRSDGPSPSPLEGTSQAPNGVTSPSSVPPEDEAVDAAVTDRGWVAEPITTDPELYARAALAAASTFDTTLASREAWLTYLDTWFTLDTRYTSDADRADALRAAQLEMRQGVVLPEEQWDSMAAEDGRVAAQTIGEMTLMPVPEDTSGGMAIGTADVTLSFMMTGGDGESSFDETVRVSVQVLCGPESVPTPGSAQMPGDCKVVRFFSEPMEP
ncbi:hypothetical protein M4I32_12935 [Microbacterium sp. LRZ72]|uniref:hypothetical protein n=1 Tax=Microbacterium sp. LRZ72 TaxID=2942481 RepID=UPI0029B4E69B|nr:hypothetical protein [Microbacterium sp. LRZ72]MDX2377707.1 hypothetical protein [Microbacterium sp. LRZ72]